MLLNLITHRLMVAFRERLKLRGTIDAKGSCEISPYRFLFRCRLCLGELMHSSSLLCVTPVTVIGWSCRDVAIWIRVSVTYRSALLSRPRISPGSHIWGQCEVNKQLLANYLLEEAVALICDPEPGVSLDKIAIPLCTQLVHLKK